MSPVIFSRGITSTGFRDSCHYLQPIQVGWNTSPSCYMTWCSMVCLDLAARAGDSSSAQCCQTIHCLNITPISIFQPTVAQTIRCLLEDDMVVVEELQTCQAKENYELAERWGERPNLLARLRHGATLPGWGGADQSKSRCRRGAHLAASSSPVALTSASCTHGASLTGLGSF